MYYSRRYLLWSLISCILFGLFCSPTFAITDPAIKNPWLDLYLEAEWLEWTPPSWFVPHNQDSAPENVDYWLDILPFAQDKNEQTYLVIPGLWLVTPVIDIPKWTQDYKDMLSGRQIPINNYLQWGIIEYVWSVDPGYLGKRVDFGHSNYFTNDSGRYKTIFANLMWVDVGDEVWYFDKQSNGQYKLFKYKVTASYPTDPSNVQALQWDGDGADALIFGCYHGLDWRWMIEATYLGTPRKNEVIEEVIDEFAMMPPTSRRRIDTAMAKIDMLWTNTKKYQIVLFYKKIPALRATLSSSDSNYEVKALILDYLEYKLSEIYPQ